MSLAPLQSTKLQNNRRLFTVEEYERMGRTGVLGPDERTELLEGEVVQVTPIGSRHAATVMRLIRAFTKFSDRLTVGAQNPVVLGAFNEPQPDIVLLKPRKDDYSSAHPRAEDIILLVEVGDSTLAMDRNIKLPMYARQGVKEVWLIDLKKNRLEVYRKPSKTGYLDVQAFTKTGSIELGQCKGVVISLREILG